MFVGATGVARILQRTCELMQQHRTDDPDRLRALGVIDLPTIQRYLNFHYGVTLDLFGADVSSNAATFYASGLKGRFVETKHDDDHLLKDATYPVLEAVDGQLIERQAPALNTLNERLRDDFIRESLAGAARWNRIIRKHGVDYELALPHKAFNRKIGSLASIKVTPEGRAISPARWDAQVRDWLPTEADRAFVQSLMGQVVEPGKFANWIAPPSIGIDKQPIDFEYVRFN